MSHQLSGLTGRWKSELNQETEEQVDPDSQNLVVLLPLGSGPFGTVKLVCFPPCRGSQLADFQQTKGRGNSLNDAAEVSMTDLCIVLCAKVIQTASNCCSA